MSVRLGSVTVWAAIFGLVWAQTSAPASAQSASPAGQLVVERRDVDDLKAVYGVIRSKDRVDARVRTPGTIASLNVKEGMYVTAGQVLALVVDDKIALHIRSLEAQMDAEASAEHKAKLDLDRALALRKQGLIAQANVDQLTSADDAAVNALKSSTADRAVLEAQTQEGEVKAPANGRVVTVPVTVGSVVMGGESIATIAANEFVIRLEVPERQARFIKEGDPITLGARGVNPSEESAGSGHITLVHPEIANGSVTADAEASGLGNYFVGERALVWISAGTRKAIVIPQDYVVTRGGYDFVKLAQDKAPPLDIVVQLGLPRDIEGQPRSVEVLSGLAAGDRLVKP